MLNALQKWYMELSVKDFSLAKKCPSSAGHSQGHPCRILEDLDRIN